MTDKIDSPSNFIGMNVRVIREQRALSQEQLATKARVSQTTIDKIERGQTKNSRFLSGIAKALGTSVEMLTEIDHTQGDAPQVSSWSARSDDVLAFVLTDRPEYAQRRRGRWRMPEHVASLRRPPFIPQPANAYAVIISDQTMEPEFEPGDIAYVNPDLPLIKETTCVFLADDAELGVGTVRRLKSFDDNWWYVQQWQPTDARDGLPRDTYQRCHRIVGRYNRR